MKGQGQGGAVEVYMQGKGVGGEETVRGGGVCDEISSKRARGAIFQ